MVNADAQTGKELVQKELYYSYFCISSACSAAPVGLKILRTDALCSFQTDESVRWNFLAAPTGNGQELTQKEFLFLFLR